MWNLKNFIQLFDYRKSIVFFLIIFKIELLFLVDSLGFYTQTCNMNEDTFMCTFSVYPSLVSSGSCCRCGAAWARGEHMLILLSCRDGGAQALSVGTGDPGCGLCLCALHQVSEVFFWFSFAENFYCEWVLNYIPCFFCIH